ncbi:hypothetical protein GCM10010873_16630 [Cypionkella aquatica]|uniref:DUF4376 domain-containing protein n=1 Tax=Cypionkella aquatica TaxID=1756042 RepID=A0AA37X0G3_9RHOB|nr:DUF4376 domain-containing protein [Cypionkella aquatica]GLS86689.1 hypothetical protein GCM10010873_16630 [Cypionkella aquatica]
MMQICYEPETGVVLFTVNGSEIPAGLSGFWIAVDDHDIGDLSAWRVIDGALVLFDLEPMRLAFRAAVNAKRLAVITAGTTVQITGHGPVALQGRPEDQTSLQGLAFGAQLRVGMGDSTTLMDFLDRENVLHQLVPMQMLELWQKGAAFVSAIYARSWAIKEMDPATTDIDDPELWVPDA